jgi:hypothetical protein
MVRKINIWILEIWRSLGIAANAEVIFSFSDPKVEILPSVKNLNKTK